MPVDVVTVQGNFAYAAHSAGGDLCIDHGYPVAWIRSADTARLGHPLAVDVAHTMAGFGVAEYLVGRDSQGLLGALAGGLGLLFFVVSHGNGTEQRSVWKLG